MLCEFEQPELFQRVQKTLWSLEDHRHCSKGTTKTLHISELCSPNQVSAPQSRLPLHSEDPYVF